MKKMIKLAANFSKKLKEISEGIKEGVQLFKDIISGRLNIKDVINELIHAISTLPQKVLKKIFGWDKRTMCGITYFYAPKLKVMKRALKICQKISKYTTSSGL